MIRRKHSRRFLEKSCSAIFGVNVFGDLEKLCSAIWRNRVRRFLEKSCSAIFGVSVFGDLEKSCSANWRNRVQRFGVLGERIVDHHGVAYSPIAVSETYNG